MGEIVFKTSQYLQRHFFLFFFLNCLRSYFNCVCICDISYLCNRVFPGAFRSNAVVMREIDCGPSLMIAPQRFLSTATSESVKSLFMPSTVSCCQSDSSSIEFAGGLLCSPLSLCDASTVSNAVFLYLHRLLTLSLTRSLLIVARKSKLTYFPSLTPSLIIFTISSFNLLLCSLISAPTSFSNFAFCILCQCSNKAKCLHFPHKPLFSINHPLVTSYIIAACCSVTHSSIQKYIVDFFEDLQCYFQAASFVL